MTASLTIGLDLDNTIICYDNAFITAAIKRGLLPGSFTGNKQQVRDHIRALPGVDGEIEWQKLQGYVYGKGITHAKLFDGVQLFLKRAKAADARLHIVSHKTEFGHFDPDRVNLRDAARKFLDAQGIFNFLSREEVYFYPTRAEKLKKIRELHCDVFVDDLEEVLIDPDFFPQTRRILFTLSTSGKAHDFESYPDWGQIEKSIFDATR